MDLFKEVFWIVAIQPLLQLQKKGVAIRGRRLRASYHHSGQYAIEDCRQLQFLSCEVS